MAAQSQETLHTQYHRKKKGQAKQVVQVAASECPSDPLRLKEETVDRIYGNRDKANGIDEISERSCHSRPLMSAVSLQLEERNRKRRHNRQNGSRYDVQYDS